MLFMIGAIDSRRVRDILQKCLTSDTWGLTGSRLTGTEILAGEYVSQFRGRVQGSASTYNFNWPTFWTKARGSIGEVATEDSQLFDEMYRLKGGHPFSLRRWTIFCRILVVKDIMQFSQDNHSTTICVSIFNFRRDNWRCCFVSHWKSALTN